MAEKEETLPEPDAWMYVDIDRRRHLKWVMPALDEGESREPLYTAATLRQAVKRANYALLMRLHEENKHKHNFFHCAAVKLMEDSK